MNCEICQKQIESAGLCEPCRFTQALATWLDGARKLVTDYYQEHYEKLEPPTLSIMPGVRYVRIVKTSMGQRSAFAFIDQKNGNVLKADGWKGPAKHARGNIYDDHNGLCWMTPQGPCYLK